MDENKEMEKLVKSTSKTVIKTMDDIIHSKTFICSIYLLKYIYDNDEAYLNKFKIMFEKFNQEEKAQVISNVINNLTEQRKEMAKKKK